MHFYQTVILGIKYVQGNYGTALFLAVDLFYVIFSIEIGLNILWWNGEKELRKGATLNEK